ncbi:vomeronasal type-1 receptor 1-like protein [Labeo rohita]|uniref:Vomeronasal type-1 receptor n=2 Tax=Labeo rohita TaxID=84645 RepID=A0A498LE69_LABRO|nr:olfactory receptor class A-like protein 1 [Labeo rohita]KAI2647861.1 Olfactory receptor class A-like protein 1 [Labeo rohita]RXN06578.1 vomeronasal type-1 receptor 1-like protein [Labeo rohita]RXN17218.1 vomeronasal type-1 receptor 1-like protein [Labeo rohita]
MNSDTLTRGLLFLSLAAAGVPGNGAVICAFVSVAYHEGRLSPADAIVLHLASANLMVVGIRCLLEVLATFEIYNVFNDTGCKAVIFVYRTTRSLSIWLTFVLSAYQCLSVAPPGSRWAAARSLLAQYLAVVFLALWLINTSMSAAPLIFAIGARNDSRLLQNGINVEFCFLSFPSKLSRDANGAAQVGRDVVPMALMATASLVILVFLYRHSRQVKGLRGGGARSSERRAALTVVTLVTLYVLFYGVDNGLWVYTLTVPQTLGSSLVSDLRIFFSSLYAAVSPVVIIVSNKKVNKQLNCGKEPKTLSDAAQPSD